MAAVFAGELKNPADHYRVAAFTKVDINKDGKLSRREANNVPGLAARFDQINANADKFVSKVEFENVIR